MKNIAPSLILLWEVKRSLEKGQSVRIGIRNYLNRAEVCNFKNQIEFWWARQNNPHFFKNEFSNSNELVTSTSNFNLRRLYLLETLEMGLKGNSILNTLNSLESELISSCESEIQNHLSQLPLKAMIPLMLFIFPSMMMLLIVPLIKMMNF